MDDIRSKIEESLKKAAEERLVRSEGSGYNVQYVPCGHAREIQFIEVKLVRKAKERKNLDAIALPSRMCPECLRLTRVTVR
jgi:hypothetical protein